MNHAPAMPALPDERILRRPRPRLAERIPLSLPDLPPAMVGRTVLHLSDLHVRRYRPWYRRLIERCARETPDLVWITGDYMTQAGDEPVAMRVMGDLLDALRPTIGIHASFGNHDSPRFKRLAMKAFPQVVWLEHDAAVLDGLDATLMGTSTPGDVLQCLRRAREAERRRGLEGRSYRIVLGHEPSILIVCAELGIQWLLAGHTHGGQVRFGLPWAPFNSCDLPMRLSSGILRCRDSICTISRGLGESYFDVRLLCPPHLPLYVLQRGPLPGSFSRKMTCVRWW